MCSIVLKIKHVCSPPTPSTSTPWYFHVSFSKHMTTAKYFRVQEVLVKCLYPNCAHFNEKRLGNRGLLYWSLTKTKINRRLLYTFLRKAAIKIKLGSVMSFGTCLNSAYKDKTVLSTVLSVILEATAEQCPQALTSRGFQEIHTPLEWQTQLLSSP